MDLEKIIALSKEIGFEGAYLRDFLNQEKDCARQEKEKQREKQEKVETHELKKLELQAQQVKAQEEADTEAENIQEHKKVELASITAEENLRKEELRIRQLESDRKSSGSTPACLDKVKLIKLPVFNDKSDNIDAYIQWFERFANSPEWPVKLWAISIASLLQGRALEIYHQLSPIEAEKYEDFEVALLRGFECITEGFGIKFRNCKLTKGESAKNLAAHMTKPLER